MTIALDGRTYIVNVMWNGRDESWHMDLLLSDSTPVAMGMKLTANWNPLRTFRGQANVPPGAFVVIDTAADTTAENTGTADPGRADLGVNRRVRLLYYTADELAAA